MTKSERPASNLPQLQGHPAGKKIKRHKVILSLFVFFVGLLIVKFKAKLAITEHLNDAESFQTVVWSCIGVGAIFIIIYTAFGIRNLVNIAPDNAVNTSQRIDDYHIKTTVTGECDISYWDRVSVRLRTSRLSAFVSLLTIIFYIKPRSYDYSFQNVAFLALFALEAVFFIFIAITIFDNAILNSISRELYFKADKENVTIQDGAGFAFKMPLNTVSRVKVTRRWLMLRVNGSWKYILRRAFTTDDFSQLVQIATLSSPRRGELATTS